MCSDDAHNKHGGVGLVALQEDLNEARGVCELNCELVVVVFRGARMHRQADIPGSNTGKLNFTVFLHYT